MKGQRVSGNIWAYPANWADEGEEYAIRCPISKCVMVIKSELLEPADLRALADRIEEKRSK